ncbi:MAG: hypothetical protein AAF085_06300, partial [Planctomycetota bacterium]
RWQPGTYIFTDLERLIGVERTAAFRLAGHFEQDPERFRILNDPRKVLMRFDLLRLLYAKGVNTFNVHRVGTPMEEIRFPVFLKREYEHSIKGIELLHNEDELSRALRRLSLKDRLRNKQLLITEYCNVSDESGNFRKYSAMRIGGRAIPRHILFSDQWLTKFPDKIDQARCQEEAAYVASAEAHPGIDEAFDIGCIDYGRVDYGLLDNQVQVWEINTNPRIVPPPDLIEPMRLDSQRDSANQINAAVADLCKPLNGESLRIDPAGLGLWRDPLRVAVYRFYAKRLRK